MSYSKKANYKKLKEYVEVVNIRNKKLEVKKLLGVSVKKVFIDSIANTVGTDFKKYKIVKKHQFVYIPDTSRRGEKIGIAMLEQYEIALVSQAYTVFEINDLNKLNPEYLMMWFRRPEFDRYARFKSHGSVREIFDWDEVCDIELPIPSIEKQNEIVKEYNTVINRIKLNETLNQKLEETAQALYKHWFVDFEFPNENGKPYKSSGGKLVFNEELDKEIPEGWEVKTLDFLVDSQYGFTASANFEIEGSKFLRITDIASDYIDWDTVPYCEITDKDFAKYKLYKGDILVARTGATVGSAKQINNNNNNLNAVFASYLVRLKPKSELMFQYLGLLVTSSMYKDYILNVAGGSAQPQANAVLMTNFKLVVSENNVIEFFNKLIEPLIDQKENIQLENSRLSELKDLLLSKMTKVESEL